MKQFDLEAIRRRNAEKIAGDCTFSFVDFGQTLVFSCRMAISSDMLLWQDMSIEMIADGHQEHHKLGHEDHAKLPHVWSLQTSSEYGGYEEENRYMVHIACPDDPELKIMSFCVKGGNHVIN